MDNFGDLVGLVAGGLWLRGRRRPNSSLAGRSTDRFSNQFDFWSTDGLKRATGAWPEDTRVRIGRSRSVTPEVARSSSVWLRHLEAVAFH